MHILIIPSWYPSKDNQIRGSFFKEQAEALYRSENKVGVIFPEARILRFGKPYGITDLGIKKKSVQGVVTLRSVRLGKIPGQSYWRERKLWTSDAMTLFKKYIESQGLPDIIHVHSVLNGGLAALSIKRMYGIPYVVTEHSSGFEQNLFNAKDKLLIKEILLESSRNLSVSQFLSDSINRYLSTKFEFDVIPNMVRNDFFRCEKNNYQNGKRFIFLSVGSLSKEKNHEELIRAFSKAFRGLSNVKLRIVGSGNLKEYLDKIIIEESMENQITLVGRVERSDILDEFTSADCFIHTSNYETFGVVIIEALAAGLPVISSACGGANTLIDDKNGILYPVGNVELLIKKLVFMHEKRKEFDSNIIRINCKNRFGEKAVLKKLLHTYRMIIGA